MRITFGVHSGFDTSAREWSCRWLCILSLLGCECALRASRTMRGP